MPNVRLSPTYFIKPTRVEVPHGASLNDISTAIYAEVGLPNICKQNEMVIEVDGEYIPKAEWDRIPEEKALVNVYMPTRGGGKSPLRLILGIGLIIATVFTGGAAAPLLGLEAGTMAAFAASAAASALVSTAGMFLVNAIAPVRPPGSKSGQAKDGQVYSISGARNQLSPYQPVPVVLGTHRFFPPLGAKPYTELVGDDEYIRILLAWVGPCKIEDIKIGDTPLTSYPGFTGDGESSYEVREGWATDDPITLIPGTVNQTRVDVKLENSTGWVDRIMPAGYDELSVEVSFPQGLVRYNKLGKRRPVTVQYGIRYRVVGDVDWTYLSDAISFPAASHAISTMANGDWFVSAKMSGDIELSQSSLPKPGTIAIAKWNVQFGLVSGLVNFSGTGKTGMVVSQVGSNMQITAGTVKFPESPFIITGTTTSLIRKAFFGKVDRTKSYEVGLARITADSTDEKTSDEIYWTVFRGTSNDPPLNFPVPMAQIALRIKATEGAQNQIDIVNCLASSYAPRFIDGEWETTATDISNNPAALFRGVLVHPANKQPRDLSQIDDDVLGEWYELCEAEGYAFNQVREFVSSVWDTLADIAFAGRGAPSLPYGKWSVDFDQATRTIKGHVTPRNSWGFRSEKVLITRPHAFKIIFNNEDKDYLEDEVYAYDDGYSKETATVIERLEFKGITSSDLAWRFGRYQIAQARLRPETYTVFMDFEHLTFRRNDLLMVSHDVPRWGDNWGRVKSLVLNIDDDIAGVVVDSEVTMEAATSYAVRFRLSDGSSLVLSVVSAVGVYTELTFTTPIPQLDGPAAGDLFMCNVADTTAVELICLGIRRQHDLVAEVTFVDHAPAIYDADTGTIPPFDSNITGRLFPLSLATPVIESVRAELYGDDVISGQLHQRIIVVGSLPDEHVAVSNREVVIRYRVKDSLEPWIYIPVTTSVIVIDVPVEGIYELQAKQKGVLQGLPGYFGLTESLWTAVQEVNVTSISELGLPAPSAIKGFYEMDAQGLVTRVKLRINLDISVAIPSAIALMVSIQQVPRELDVTDHSTYVTVDNANVLNSGSFTVLAGSTSDNIVVATTANPLPSIDLSGFFWGSLDGVVYRKATGSTTTAFQFAEPFTTGPMPGGTLSWVELAWADERADDFKLMQVVAADGSMEVAKWTAISYTSGKYRIAIDRAQEGTTQKTADKVRYYPAPGAGTETILVPASNFVEVENNVFEGSSDAQIQVPPGSWIAVTMATYVLEGMRVIRSPIVPITDWTRL